MKTTLKQKVVKTTRAKQNLWCYMSKQETALVDKKSITSKLNCTRWSGWRWLVRLYRCLEKYSS